ncbi:hydroxyacid dehydrogenase [Terrarubrum flagellatum]|uniref:hydroxyacid dehydrogenase n=1 Tax=Terrirubrum flagellatum TaxID=2895980 RepID=UPI0031455A39
MTNRPIVAVLLAPAMREMMLTKEAQARLADVAEVRIHDAAVDAAALPKLLDGASAALTGWGTPPLTAEILAAHPDLRLVAHSAGSIRKLVPLDAVAEGRPRVTHAAQFIAAAVAEFVIAQTLSVLRSPHRHDAGMKAGEGWFDLRERYRGRLLGAMTVGIVGAGYVGRAVIALFKAFGCRVLVNDPQLTAERVQALGVEITSLDDLLKSCDVISLHAPALPETERMIGAHEFALLRDGALFINTARSLIVDQQVQFEALRSGRFNAILDVFDIEPLPPDDPLRGLPNVWLSPHAAGHSADTYALQGGAAVDDIARFLRGEPLRHEVSPAMLATMA